MAFRSGDEMLIRTPRLPYRPTGLGHMQSDIDAQLTNFFDDQQPREFAKVMRGYDPQQVNEHLSQVEGDLRQQKDQVQGLHRDLAEAHRQLQEQERPTYSGLGARIEQLLRLAEEQATELVQAARSEANEIKACLLYTSPSPRDGLLSRMPSSA